MRAAAALGRQGLRVPCDRGTEVTIPRSSSWSACPRSMIPMPRPAGKWGSTRAWPPALKWSAGPSGRPLASWSAKPESAARHQGHPPRNTRPV